MTSVPGWWGAGGRAGWRPDAELGIGGPWTLAGLVVGAWALEEDGRAPVLLPAPGARGAEAAAVGFDSLDVRAGEGGAWEGFAAALARARAGPGLDRRPAPGRRSRTDVVLTSGARGLRDNAVGLWRGDSLGGLRVEAASGERAAAGGIAGGGRDRYGIAGARGRGPHRIEAAFGHRRALAQLAGGASQESRHEAGVAGYRFLGRRWSLGATVERGYGHHDSRGPGAPEARRLADATGAALTVEREGFGGRWGVRGAWQEERVTPDAAAGVRARARQTWAAARWRGPVGEGELELGLGAGLHDALGGATVAPALAWRFHGPTWQGRVTVERLATPVWSDLAPGQAPFLQDSWVGGIGLGADLGRGRRARVGFLVGHTRGRAILSRLPLEALALRTGARADPRGYDFGLLTGEASWRSGRWAAAVEGFALARDASPAQPGVDPARGGRVAAEATFRAFRGDLAIRPGVDAWLIGPRESEAVAPRSLPGYGMVGASLGLTLADATLRVEGRNLTDRRAERTWVDAATGVEALGPGRELRVALFWRLWD